MYVDEPPAHNLQAVGRRVALAGLASVPGVGAPVEFGCRCLAQLRTFASYSL